MSVASRWPSYAPYLLSVLRMVTAFVFITFGTMKLLPTPNF